LIAETIVIYHFEENARTRHRRANHNTAHMCKTLFVQNHFVLILFSVSAADLTSFMIKTEAHKEPTTEYLLNKSPI